MMSIIEIGTIVSGNGTPILQTKAGEWVATLFGDWLAAKVDASLLALHVVLPDALTLSIVACGLILMLPGTDKHKWFARLATIFVVGVILLVI